MELTSFNNRLGCVLSELTDVRRELMELKHLLSQILASNAERDAHQLRAIEAVTAAIPVALPATLM
jgi:hypothetical protein